MAVKAWAAGMLFTGGAGSAPVDPGLAADDAFFGLEDAALPKAERALEHWPGVYAFLVDAVEAFIVCATQWRTLAGPEGTRFVGIDYAAAKIAWDAAGIEMKRAGFNRFRQIEAIATRHMNGETI